MQNAAMYRPPGTQAPRFAIPSQLKPPGGQPPAGEAAGVTFINADDPGSEPGSPTSRGGPRAAASGERGEGEAEAEDEGADAKQRRGIGRSDGGVVGAGRGGGGRRKPVSHGFTFRDLSVGHGTSLQPLTAKAAFKLHASVASNPTRRHRPLVLWDTQVTLAAAAAATGINCSMFGRAQRGRTRVWQC
jgi:hypothetical protein